MNRRSFLSVILATGIAPAIVRADSLMRIVPRDTTVMELVWAETTPVLRRFRIPIATNLAATWVGDGDAGMLTPTFDFVELEPLHGESVEACVARYRERYRVLRDRVFKIEGIRT